MNDPTRQHLTLEPVGVFHCDRRYRYEAPRQASLDEAGAYGAIRLFPRRNFEQALRSLAGFERLWLIYGFHQNTRWKPIVRPPRAGAPRVGVFASRAPYRPNPIGLSCVELVAIHGLELIVREFDLLDETPIYDIKPYLPYADSFPGARAGWADAVTTRSPPWALDVGETARQKAAWLVGQNGPDLLHFAHVQLRQDPLDRSRKRIASLKGSGQRLTLAYRTFRIVYSVHEWDARIEHAGPAAKCEMSPLGDTGRRIVRIEDIRSGYAPDELNGAGADRYGDFDLHRRFVGRFGQPDD